MFCPNCGQERFSEATSFCSRCGYRLTETAELLKRGGAIGPSGAALVVEEADRNASQSRWSSPRARGIKMGVFMMLMVGVLMPILGMLLVFGLGMRTPWPIGVVLFLLGGGGLLRIAYALMFEAGAGAALLPGAEPHGLGHKSIGSDAAAFLPPQQTFPVGEYTAPRTGRWRDTNELEPTSVTENTTKLLEKEDD